MDFFRPATVREYIRFTPALFVAVQPMGIACAAVEHTVLTEAGTNEH